jgi:hypothetical protein
MSPQSQTLLIFRRQHFGKVKVIEKRRGISLTVGIHKAYFGGDNIHWKPLNIEDLMSRIAFEKANGDVLVMRVGPAEQ